MSVTRTWGAQVSAPWIDLVVVGRHPHHPEVGVPGDQGAHPLTHDQIVVGQEDVDRARRGRMRQNRWSGRSIASQFSHTRSVPVKGGDHPRDGVVLGTPGACLSAHSSAAFRGQKLAL